MSDSPSTPSTADARPMFDDLGRPSITDSMKAQIAQSFAAVPPDKRSAFILIVDDRGNARGHLAVRVGDVFKVAAGGGYQMQTKRPSGFIGIEAAW